MLFFPHVLVFFFPALEEDANAFEYDSVFDQMTQKKEEMEHGSGGKEKAKDRTPKYMPALLKAAKNREREHERREERKVQRERETEGGEFADKEAFVTSAYKKKRQEMKEGEARDKELARVEDLLDVTKQKDMSVFYRHLLKQTTGEEKVGYTPAVATSSNVPPPQSINQAPERVAASSKRREMSPDDLPVPKKQEKMENTTRHDHSDNGSGEDREDEDGIEEPEDAAVSVDVVPPKSVAPTQTENKDVFAKHTTEDSVMSARERYLARLAAKAKQT